MLATKLFIKFELWMIFEYINVYLIEFYRLLNIKWTLKEDRLAVIACTGAVMGLIRFWNNWNILIWNLKIYLSPHQWMYLWIQRNPTCKQKLTALSCIVVKMVLNISKKNRTSSGCAFNGPGTEEIQCIIEAVSGKKNTAVFLSV